MELNLGLPKFYGGATRETMRWLGVENTEILDVVGSERYPAGVILETGGVRERRFSEKLIPELQQPGGATSKQIGL